MSKRFTDTELAAEYWRSVANIERVEDYLREYRNSVIIKRFVQRPHFDEING